MIYDEYDNYYYIVIDNFLSDEIGIEIYSNFISYFQYNTNNFEFIKTALSPDLSKAIVIMNPSSGIPYYFLYDVNAELEYELKNFNHQLHCRNEYHGIKINYNNEKEEYIFSCIDNNGKISVEFFNKNLIYYNYTSKYNECENIYGYSILYLNKGHKYYILSDVSCQGEKYPFNLLYG